MQAWVFITKVPVAASSYIGIKDWMIKVKVKHSECLMYLQLFRRTGTVTVLLV
jgi:hypothetical protein